MLRTVAMLAVVLLTGCDLPDDKQLAMILAEVEEPPRSDTKVLQSDGSNSESEVLLSNLRDPFQWANVFSSEQSASRIRDLLEEHPLESLFLVGVMTNQRHRLAFVKSPQGVHRIQTGQHIGIHEGRVIEILQDSIEIQEPGAEEGQGAIQRLIMRSRK